MAVTKTKLVSKGAWRTLESGWKAQFWVSFFMPSTSQIKVRYGGGWPFGWDSQKQTLDGNNVKVLQVTNSSLVYARIQVYVQQNCEISYVYYPGPFNGLTPQ